MGVKMFTLAGTKQGEKLWPDMECMKADKNGRPR